MSTDIAIRVLRTISPLERMPAEDVDGYLAVGASALRAIRLAQAAANVPDFASILDFPSGHGRVLRWLKAAYPTARITASDILTDGVDWCVGEFGATGIYSEARPDISMFDDRYDLIWVGSLLTHVDVPQWRHLISLWNDLLMPNGLLVITTHGEYVAERMAAGHLYGYPEAQVRRLVRTYRHASFGFLEESPSSVDYGITISRPHWVVREVLRHADLRLVLASETLWDNHQDVYGFLSRPLHVPAADGSLDRSSEPGREVQGTFPSSTAPGGSDKTQDASG